MFLGLGCPAQDLAPREDNIRSQNQNPYGSHLAQRPQRHLLASCPQIWQGQDAGVLIWGPRTGFLSGAAHEGGDQTSDHPHCLILDAGINFVLWELAQRPQ